MHRKVGATQQQLFVSKRKKYGLRWFLMTMVMLLVRAVQIFSVVGKIMDWLDKFSS